MASSPSSERMQALVDSLGLECAGEGGQQALARDLLKDNFRLSGPWSSTSR
jgi:hypothetical protein